jgi:hypothetical protein
LAAPYNNTELALSLSLSLSHTHTHNTSEVEGEEHASDVVSGLKFKSTAQDPKVQILTQKALQGTNSRYKSTNTDAEGAAGHELKVQILTQKALQGTNSTRPTLLATPLHSCR